MTSQDLPRHVFAIVISLARAGWAYAHWIEGSTRHIEARHGGHELNIAITGSHLRATLDSNHLSRRRIKETIETIGAQK